jgi:hypothetical protein
MMFACLVAHPLDVRLGRADIQEGVVDGLGELFRLNQSPPGGGSGIAASIATGDFAACA